MIRVFFCFFIFLQLELSLPAAEPTTLDTTAPDLEVGRSLVTRSDTEFHQAIYKALTKEAPTYELDILQAQRTFYALEHSLSLYIEEVLTAELHAYSTTYTHLSPQQHNTAGLISLYLPFLASAPATATDWQPTYSAAVAAILTVYSPTSAQLSQASQALDLLETEPSRLRRGNNLLKQVVERGAQLIHGKTSQYPLHPYINEVRYARGLHTLHHSNREALEAAATAMAAQATKDNRLPAEIGMLCYYAAELTAVRQLFSTLASNLRSYGYQAYAENPLPRDFDLREELVTHIKEHATQTPYAELFVRLFPPATDDVEAAQHLSTLSEAERLEYVCAMLTANTSMPPHAAVKMIQNFEALKQQLISHVLDQLSAEFTAYKKEFSGVSTSVHHTACWLSLYMNILTEKHHPAGVWHTLFRKTDETYQNARHLCQQLGTPMESTQILPTTDAYTWKQTLGFVLTKIGKRAFPQEHWYLAKHTMFSLSHPTYVPRHGDVLLHTLQHSIGEHPASSPRREGASFYITPLEAYNSGFFCAPLLTDIATLLLLSSEHAATQRKDVYAAYSKNPKKGLELGQQTMKHIKSSRNPELEKNPFVIMMMQLTTSCQNDETDPSLD